MSGTLQAEPITNPSEACIMHLMSATSCGPLQTHTMEATTNGHHRTNYRCSFIQLPVWWNRDDLIRRVRAGRVQNTDPLPWPVTNPDRRERHTMITTEYGSWNGHIGGSAATVADTVTAYLGEFADDYDVQAVIDQYRHEINHALPVGVSLNGDQFYGPYPRDTELVVEIGAVIGQVDLGQIVAQNDTAAGYRTW